MGLKEIVCLWLSISRSCCEIALNSVISVLSVWGANVHFMFTNQLYVHTHKHYSLCAKAAGWVCAVTHARAHTHTHSCWSVKPLCNVQQNGDEATLTHMIPSLCSRYRLFLRQMHLSSRTPLLYLECSRTVLSSLTFSSLMFYNVAVWFCPPPALPITLIPPFVHIR